MEKPEIDFNELKNVNYELFLVAITSLSVINILFIYFAPSVVMRQVVVMVDFVLCFFFLGDFLYRLLTSSNKTRYLIRQYGWLDLIGSLPIPGVRVVRLVRSSRTIRLLRRYGSTNLQSDLGQDRAGSTLLSVLFLGIMVLEFGSYFMLGAEARAPDSNIRTPSDALWWSVVTIATVGYGDKYPVTNQGRIIGTIVIITGVGIFGAFTGFLANSFINRRRIRKRAGTLIEPSTIEPSTAEQLDEIKQLLEVQSQRLAAIEVRLPPAPTMSGENLGAQPGETGSKEEQPS